jgi:4-hydroxy-tetrahydrodipicolinate reductase
MGSNPGDSLTRIGLVGAMGRMGRAVAEAAGGLDDMVIARGVEHPGHPDIGKPFGQGNLAGRLEDVLDLVDVVADFALADGCETRANLAAGSGKAYVTGITGLSQEQVRALERAGNRTPVVYAPNFSRGVNLLYRLAQDTAKALGPEYDIEVLETHHRQKKDAPSGTARKLVDILSRASSAQEVVYGREGETGGKPLRQIGVSSVRTGDVVGEHTVVFGGAGERIELTHRAGSRQAFAAGVITAVRFVRDRKPGFYSMSDVLGI